MVGPSKLDVSILWIRVGLRYRKWYQSKYRLHNPIRLLLIRLRLLLCQEGRWTDCALKHVFVSIMHSTTVWELEPKCSSLLERPLWCPSPWTPLTNYLDYCLAILHDLGIEIYLCSASNKTEEKLVVIPICGSFLLKITCATDAMVIKSYRNNLLYLSGWLLW